MADAPEAGVAVITGSTGPIGSRLMHRLDGPYHVIGLDVREQAAAPPHAE